MSLLVSHGFLTPWVRREDHRARRNLVDIMIEPTFDFKIKISKFECRNGKTLVSHFSNRVLMVFNRDGPCNKMFE
jgi:hypothetical protein